MKNKKVGILTFHNTVNYGAMLQTYALQSYVNGKGVECEVIDYRNDALEKIERPMKLFAQRSPKGVLKYFKCHRYQVRKWDRFEAFRRENVKMSEGVYTKADIASADGEYGAFIVGSDQVWNGEITNGDRTYFLDFVKDDSKKYAYAASFGFEKWPEGERDAAIGYIDKFKAVSVRERQAKALIDAELGKGRADVVCDPTLLISKSDWEKFENSEALRDCIVVYMIDFCKEVFDFIRGLADKTGCKVVYVHDAIRSQSGMINSRDDTVEDFISMIKNARYVVTGSFHALCMSLVLEKQIYYTLNSKSNRNSRLVNLTEAAGITHRKVTDGKCESDMPIDYTDVKARLTPIIDESKKILDGMLKEMFIDEQN